MTKQRYSILVVDDDEDTRQNLSDILQDMDYDVETAPDGESALDMIRSKPYDVALLDLKMPGMDGLTLYHEIRKLRAGTVAMIVTAYATAETTQEALEAGAWRVLSKPVDFPNLLTLVETAVDQPLIMIVDDDRELCDSLWDLFREKGYRVCTAHDADRARERLQERNYQVFIVDLKLPAGNGTDLLDDVRLANPDARSVLITGHRDEMQAAINRAIRDGANAVCYKPFDVPALLDTIVRLTHKEE